MSSCQMQEKEDKKKLFMPHYYFINVYKSINKTLFKKEKVKNNLLIITEKRKENLLLNDINISEKIDTNFTESKIKAQEREPQDYYNQSKYVSHRYSPLVALDLVDDDPERLPFEEPSEDDSINRRAVIEVGVKKQGDFSFVVRSSFANVSYSNQNSRHQVDLDPNDQIEDLEFGVKLSF